MLSFSKTLAMSNFIIHEIAAILQKSIQQTTVSPSKCNRLRRFCFQPTISEQTFERLEIETASMQNKSNYIEIDVAILRSKLEIAEDAIVETQNQTLQLNSSNNLLQIQIVRLGSLTSELGSTSASLHDRTESLFLYVSTIEQNIQSLEKEVASNKNYSNYIILGMLQF